MYEENKDQYFFNCGIIPTYKNHAKKQQFKKICKKNMSVIEIQIANEQGKDVCQKLTDFINVIGYSCRNYRPKQSSDKHIQCRIKYDSISDMANATRVLYIMKDGRWPIHGTLPVTIVSSPMAYISSK